MTSYEVAGEDAHDRLGCMSYLQTEFRMDSLRQGPEYRQLLHEIDFAAQLVAGLTVLREVSRFLQ